MIYDSQLRKQYKAQARADIKAAFWPTMGAVFLFMLPTVLITIIYQIVLDGTTNTDVMASIGQIYGALGIYLLAILFIVTPIQFGAKHYFVARARGEQASPTLVFSCFADGKKYLTSIKVVLCILARSIGWILLLVAVSVVVTVAMIFTAIGDMDSVALSTRAKILIVMYFIVLIVISMFISVKIRRYDGSYIRMIDAPDASVWAATGSCVPVFKKHNWELLMFDLSFLLWSLLSVITFGIVGIYTTAYMEISFVHYFDALSQKQPRQSASDTSGLL